LIIDMLNDFFRQEALAARRADLVHAINDLIALFRERRWPIIWVRQEFAPDLSDAFLVLRDTDTAITIAGTDGCQILPELDVRVGDRIVVKKRYSAFFGTGLDGLLASWRPSMLVLAGVNTHACVRMTAIDAYQRDYRVVIATDCVSSYDDEHHRITMRYLGGIMQMKSHTELGEGPNALFTVRHGEPGRGRIRHGPGGDDDCECEA
jgi:nicotinamidase-related amidase